jgi:hypothetical protein
MYQYKMSSYSLASRRNTKKLDRKTRKILTIHGEHQPRADTDRLYVPRKEEGRALMQMELTPCSKVPL